MNEHDPAPREQIARDVRDLVRGRMFDSSFPPGATLIMIDDCIRDIRHGLRLLWRNPAFAAVVLGTLGLAMGASLTMFSVVDAWMFKPLNFPQADRLVVAFAATPDRPREPAVWMPYREYLAWKENSRSFSALGAAFMREATVTTNGRSEGLLGVRVTPELFDTLGVRPQLGRPFAASDVTGAPVVVLAYGFWQRYLGGARDAVGRTISLSGTPHLVVGVLPRAVDFRLLDMHFDFWTPIRQGDAGYQPGGLAPVAIVGRLRDGLRREAATAEVAAITKRIESGYAENFNNFVVNLTSLQDDNVRSVRATLLTCVAGAAGLLLIAAMNVGTLLLGRGLTRTREVSIRAALGSERGRVARQFLTESLVIAVLGGVLALLIAVIATRLFVVWNPLGSMPANAIAFDWRILAAAAGMITVTTLICGLVPAVRISASNPSDMLRAGGYSATAAHGHRAQTAMLVGQMAASIVLLVSTTLLARTFVRLHAEPLGFEPVNLSVASVILPNDAFDSSEKRNLFYRQLAENVTALPGVRAVAAGSSRPLSSGPPVTVYKTLENDPNAARISAQDVTSDFFSVMRIPVVTGRAFDDRDLATGAPVLIVNARAASDLFGSASAAIGRRVRLNREPPREVVGVVGNVRASFFNTLAWRTDPIVYRPATQAFDAPLSPAATGFEFNLHIRADRPMTFEQMRLAMTGIDRRASIGEVRSAPELIGEATRQPSFRMALLSWFAVASLLLAGIGVYGVVAQGIALRLREFAIRLALGARPSSLMRTIVMPILVAGIAGLIVGGVIVVMLGATLTAVLYGVRPTDATAIATAATALLTVVIVAASVPGFRVTRVQPIAILRGE
jgi:predicted permease